MKQKRFKERNLFGGGVQCILFSFLIRKEGDKIKCRKNYVKTVRFQCIVSS